MDVFETAKQSFLEGLHLLEANNLRAAESKFARSLELVPDRASTLNNLSAIKVGLGKFAEAEAFARKAIASEDKSPEAWSNLGIALTKTNRHEEALLAYDRALQCDPAYTKAWLNKATTLLELARYDEALLACDQSLTLDANQHQVLHTKSLILKELERLDEAQKIYRRSLAVRVASSPVYIASRCATQKAEALIISHDPPLDDSLKSFEALHLDCLNYPGQLSRQLRDEFHFTFVFEGEATDRSTRMQIPPPDFVINNCANGERVLAHGNLTRLVEAVESFGVPVVNHPTKVVHSTRDASVKLLADLPGVLVPKTARFSSTGKTAEAVADEIEAHFDYPIITRSLTAQKGVGMNKVDSRAALITALASDIPENFFVTQFVDSRGGNEYYRKIRASIVQDELVIVRVDFHPDWKVHGGRSGKRVSFYLENGYLLDQEKRICADPEKELGGAAMQSLRALRDRIPLDVFGLDFEVDADGSVIFYEANATMNLLSTAQKEVPNPKESEERLQQAFRRYLTSLVDSPTRKGWTPYRF